MWRTGIPPGFEDVARLWRGATTEDRLAAANTIIQAGYELVGPWNPQSLDMPVFKWWEPEPAGVTIPVWGPTDPWWRRAAILIAVLIGTYLFLRRA